MRRYFVKGLGCVKIFAGNGFTGLTIAVPDFIGVIVAGRFPLTPHTKGLLGS
jgi:hypothetical protein